PAGGPPAGRGRGAGRAARPASRPNVRSALMDRPSPGPSSCATAPLFVDRRRVTPGQDSALQLDPRRRVVAGLLHRPNVAIDARRTIRVPSPGRHTDLPGRELDPADTRLDAADAPSVALTK